MPKKVVKEYGKAKPDKSMSLRRAIKLLNSESDEGKWDIQACRIVDSENENRALKAFYLLSDKEKAVWADRMANFFRTDVIMYLEEIMQLPIDVREEGSCK